MLFVVREKKCASLRSLCCCWPSLLAFDGDTRAAPMGRRRLITWETFSTKIEQLCKGNNTSCAERKVDGKPEPNPKAAAEYLQWLQAQTALYPYFQSFLLSFFFVFFFVFAFLFLGHSTPPSRRPCFPAHPPLSRAWRRTRPLRRRRCAGRHLRFQSSKCRKVRRRPRRGRRNASESFSRKSTQEIEHVLKLNCGSRPPRRPWLSRGAWRASTCMKKRKPGRRTPSAS